MEIMVLQNSKKNHCITESQGETILLRNPKGKYHISESKGNPDVAILLS